MKKSTIVSIVLALMAATTAAIDRVPIMKTAGLFETGLGESGKCVAFKCIKKGQRCSASDDNQMCGDFMSCIDGKCDFYKEGSPCEKDCANDFDDDDLYCGNDKKCYKKVKERDACTYEGECKSGLFCNAKEPTTPGVCVKNPTKVGDECNTNEHCPGDSRCYKNVCTVRPTTVGAECDSLILPCDNNLICDNENKKCAELPGENETCINNKCAEGLICDYEKMKCISIPGLGEDCLSMSPYCDEDLYCNSTDKKCAKLPGTGETCTLMQGCAGDNYCDTKTTNKCIQYPGLGEECYKSYYCQKGLKCSNDKVDNKKICRSTDGKMDGYCNNYDTPCANGFVCDINRQKCIEGECGSDTSCPRGKGCSNFKCVDFMSVEDGGECDNSGSSGFFVCKEGSGCISSANSSTGYKCAKITTSLNTVISCTGEGDPNCPADSYCDCNSVKGRMQCVPYPANSKKAVEEYNKYMDIKDPKESDVMTYLLAVMKLTRPHDGSLQCIDGSVTPSGSSSSIKPLAFTLVLFFVGFVKAFF